MGDELNDDMTMPGGAGPLDNDAPKDDEEETEDDDEEGDAADEDEEDDE